MYIDREPFDYRSSVSTEATTAATVVGLVLYVPIAILLVTIYGAAALFLLRSLKTAVGWAANVTFIAVPLLILLTGAVLFWSRMAHRHYYGIAEVLTGLILSVLGTMQATQWKATTMEALFRENELLPVGLALGSALFIVVRGLDNMREGKKMVLLATELQQADNVNEKGKAI